MRRVTLLLTLMGALLLACSGVTLAQQTDRTPSDRGGGLPSSAGKAGEAVPGEYIVLFKDEVRDPPRRAANEMAQQHGLSLGHVYEHAVRGFSSTIPDARLAAVREDARVQKVEQVVLQEIVAGDEMPRGVDRGEGDLNQSANSGDGNTVNMNKAVAIIDTGLYKHADLDVKGGYNATGSNTSRWSDGHGHGTHVAGTVGAKDNGSGVLGVAPGADLYASKVCDANGSCQSSWMVKGIDWVAGRKAEFNDGSGDGDAGVDFAAANMSISTPDDSSACSSNSDATHRAICGLVDKGVVFTLAAGNNNRLKSAYPEALTVSALADFDGKSGKQGSPTCRTDEDDTLASFSNYGPDIDLAAPGVCIKSTWNNGGYNTISGTSMAAPHAAGTVALYLQANGQPTAKNGTDVDAIEKAILDVAKPQSLTGDQCGYTNEKASNGSDEALLFVNSSSFGGTGVCY